MVAIAWRAARRRAPSDTRSEASRRGITAAAVPMRFEGLAPRPPGPRGALWPALRSVAFLRRPRPSRPALGPRRPPACHLRPAGPWPAAGPPAGPGAGPTLPRTPKPWLHAATSSACSSTSSARSSGRCSPKPAIGRRRACIVRIPARCDLDQHRDLPARPAPGQLASEYLRSDRPAGPSAPAASADLRHGSPAACAGW